MMNRVSVDWNGRSAVFRPAGLVAIRFRPTTGTRRLRVSFRSRCSSSSSDENGGGSATQSGSQLKQTVADLDAILGIEEEEKEKTAESTSSKETSSELSPSLKDEINLMADKVAKEYDDDPKLSQENLAKTIMDIVKSATENAEGKSDDKDVLKSVEKLLQSAAQTEEANEDTKIIKERVFGADSFWVTDVGPANDAFGGLRFRGNMRVKNEREAFEKVESRIKSLFGEKYEVMMFEEPLTPEQMLEDDPKRKPCFQIIPAEMARPPKSPSWRPVAAGVLFLFTLATTYVLGISANIGNIPQPIVEYLSKPENLNAEQWPDFVRNWDPSTFLTSAGTISIGIMFSQLIHEVGHRIAAYTKKVKLKGSLLLPNTQIGTFGSVTQLDSMVKTRQDLWDLAFAGLASGGFASLALFITGIIIAQDTTIPKEALVPVPSVLLQGSTLIGGFLQAVLGDIASQKTVFLHPFTVAGWCGLTATALNALPVGNLDGGRLMLSAYGYRSLGISSIFTYAGLALGIIGSSLALPFGLYVLICVREPEAYIQNQITPTERNRQWITIGSILLAFLILFPIGLFDANDPGLNSGPFL